MNMHVGQSSAKERLRLVALEIFERCKGDRTKAAMALWLQAKSVPDYQRIICEHYFDGFKYDGGGHYELDTKACHANPVVTPSGRGGHESIDTHPCRASTSATSKQPPRPSVGRLNGLFETLKTGDGRAWGEIYWHELYSMGRDGKIAKAILAKYRHPTTNKPVKLSEHIPEKEFAALVKEALAK